MKRKWCLPTGPMTVRYPRFCSPHFLDYCADPQSIIRRRDRIVAARARGETLQQIGKAEQLTRERVRQILKKASSLKE